MFLIFLSFFLLYLDLFCLLRLDMVVWRDFVGIVLVYIVGFCIEFRVSCRRDLLRIGDTYIFVCVGGRRILDLGFYGF